MILVSGVVVLPAGGLEKLRPAMAAMIAASRAEPGCLAYSYGVDVLDETRIHVHELWRDRAALDAHFQMPHLSAWRVALAQAGMISRTLKAYEVDGGRPV